MMGWVLRVIAGALSPADTLEVCHSLVRVLLSAMESMEGKR